MSVDGEIIFEYSKGSPDNFQWQGGLVASIPVRTLIRLGVNTQEKYFRIGPFWLRNLGTTEDGFCLRVMRSMGLYADLVCALWFSLRKRLKLINDRVLWTLEIWNLREATPGCYPKWTDVRLVKWFKRQLSRR